MVNLEGSSTSVTYYQAGISSMLAYDNPLTLGNDGALMDDMALSANNPVDACVWIENLRPGRYEVYIYALTPDNSSLMNRCRVDNAFSGPVFVGGEWTGDHQENISYSRHTVLLSGVGTIGLHAGLYGQNSQSGINGIQLKHFGEPVAVYPQSVSALRGSIVSGDVPELLAADDQRLVMRPGAVIVSSEAPAQLVMEATAPVDEPFRFVLRVESSATIANLVQTTAMWNYQTLSWVNVNTRQLSTADSTFDYFENTNAKSYVEPATRKMKIKVSYKPSGAVLVFPWNARLDQVRCTVTP